MAISLRAYLQDDYLYINKKHQGRDDGNNWTTAVICECWTNWYSLWEMRNLVIHGRNVAEVNQLKRRYAVQDLNAIYEMRDQLLPRDRDLLMESAEVHATKTTRQIRNWITTFRPIIQHSVKTAAKHAITGVKSIREYFLPSNNS